MNLKEKLCVIKNYLTKGQKINISEKQIDHELQKQYEKEYPKSLNNQKP